MREAWRPLLFADDELAAWARTRDPVAAAERQKVTRRAADGPPLHSFRTLLEDLATVTRNVCRTKGETDTRQTEFELDTQLSAEQARILKLLKGIRFQRMRPSIVDSRREFHPSTSDWKTRGCARKPVRTSV